MRKMILNVLLELIPVIYDTSQASNAVNKMSRIYISIRILRKYNPLSCSKNIRELCRGVSFYGKLKIRDALHLMALFYTQPNIRNRK